MEYQIAVVTNGLVMLQREDNLDWVISEKLTEIITPISITLGYKTEADTVTQTTLIREQSADVSAQVLTTLMIIIDEGYTELAKEIASCGESYYTSGKPIGIYVSQNANMGIADSSDNWSALYAKRVFDTVAEVYDINWNLDPFESDRYAAEDILEYYHKEMAKYITRQPEILKMYPKISSRPSAFWINNLGK